MKLNRKSKLACWWLIHLLQRNNSDVTNMKNLLICLIFEIDLHFDLTGHDLHIVCNV